MDRVLMVTRSMDRGLVVWLSLFLVLSSLDAYITNVVIGNGRGYEANPFLVPFAGSWVLYMKAVIFLPMALIVCLVSRWMCRRFNGRGRVVRVLVGTSPVRMEKVLMWACIALGLVCIWNTGVLA